MYFLRFDDISSRRSFLVTTVHEKCHTPLLVDVDDEGRILVTDHHSANGVEAQSYPPIVLDPGTPYVIQPGTSLLVGDVILTVGVSHPFS